MNNAEQYLKRIQDKLQHLLKSYSTLEKENVKLKEELHQLKQQDSNYNEKINDLKQQVDVLKINAGEMNETDKKEIEKKINSYIKEIDRCIALLSN